MPYSFFWVIPRRLNFIFRRFGTLFSILVGHTLVHTTYAYWTECSETSWHKIQPLGNRLNERIQYTNIDQSNNMENVRHVRVIPSLSVQSINRTGEITLSNDTSMVIITSFPILITLFKIQKTRLPRHDILCYNSSHHILFSHVHFRRGPGVA